MKYFKGIYDFLKNENDLSFNIDDKDYELFIQEEECILKSLGKDFKNKYLAYEELHDCPLVSIKIDFSKQKKTALLMTFLDNQSNPKQEFTITYSDIYDYDLSLSNNFISSFNLIDGNKCLISEFSKDNKLYTHEIAFSDGSRVVVRFKKAKSISISANSIKAI